jgi:hypothetical protein
VSAINANLSTATDITQARILPENRRIAFMGDTKVGPFEIPEALAREWLPLRNPNGKPNAEVVRPWANGLEVTRTPQKLWIVDFPPGMSETEAAQYEAPLRVHPDAREALSREGKGERRMVDSFSPSPRHAQGSQWLIAIPRDTEGVQAPNPRLVEW